MTAPAKQAHYDTAAVVLELLAERFPTCFAIHQARRRPLKVGIHHDILAELDGAITPQELGIALRIYTGNVVYMQRLVAGAGRIDLSGQVAGAREVGKLP
jgi:ProP effector